jgi:hypothetical protein
LSKTVTSAAGVRSTGSPNRRISWIDTVVLLSGVGAASSRCSCPF